MTFNEALRRMIQCWEQHNSQGGDATEVRDKVQSLVGEHPAHERACTIVTYLARGDIDDAIEAISEVDGMLSEAP